MTATHLIGDQITEDLLDVGIPRLQRYYAEGKYTAREVTAWHLDRIACFDHHYNAFIKLFGDQALARAAELDAAGGERKQLWGVPLVVKGSISIAGEITTVGWWGYTLPGKELRARAHATAVEKVTAAGAIIIGHTNLPDLAAANTTISTVAGRTGNAYNPIFSAGGSSGGSGVAVAASFAVAGLGTDGGNSIRNPAANLALVGVLPTQGLISIAGVHASDWLRERTGPMCRTVEDAAIMLEVLSGHDPRDPNMEDTERYWPLSFVLKRGALRGTRLGVPKFILDGTPQLRPNVKYWNNGTSPRSRTAFMSTVEELRAAGATIIFDDAILPEKFLQLVERIEAERYLRQGIDRFLADYGPEAYGSTEVFEEVSGVTYPPDYPSSRHELERDPEAEARYFGPRRDALRLYEETMQSFELDAFVYPPLQVPPNPERVPLPDDYPSRGPYSATGWANRLGIPAIVVPAGFYRSGLPFGVEFAGRRWDDAKLLGIAYDYEQSTRHRKPPHLIDRAGSMRSSDERV